MHAMQLGTVKRRMHAIQTLESHRCSYQLTDETVCCWTVCSCRTCTAYSWSACFCVRSPRAFAVEVCAWLPACALNLKFARGCQDVRLLVGIDAEGCRSATRVYRAPATIYLPMHDDRGGGACSWRGWALMHQPLFQCTGQKGVCPGLQCPACTSVPCGVCSRGAHAWWSMLLSTPCAGSQSGESGLNMVREHG